MGNKTFAVLDIGTSKVTCMVAEKVSDKSEFVLRAVGQSNYNGYDNSGWYEPDTLCDVIKQAISQVENKLKIKIKDIVVGVPCNFCYCATSEASTVFSGKKKIDAYDINDIYVKADIFGDNATGTLISRNAVYYTIDDSAIVGNAIGAVARKLSALVTFSFVNVAFEKSIVKALAFCGIHKYKFVNSSELQSKYVGGAYNINGYSIIIDVGHLNTSVMLHAGKGILFAKCFDLGSGYIAADICQVLKIAYSQSVALLEKIDLNLEFSTGDTYTLASGVTVDAHTANEVAKARIEQIAQYIKKSFEYCDRPIPANTPIVLTGGGLTYIRGGSEWLSKYLGKDIVVYSNDNPQLNRNEYTSCYGLLSYCVGISNNENPSFLKRLFSRR